jgi:glyoxylase-like metal-dependent hydrolase (beta-lactamase superfamily II)
MDIAIFTFNPFAENTFVLYDETGECIIVDPGCNDPHEEKTLKEFIEGNKLKPVKLVNTHFHIDHVLGNQFVADTFGLSPEMHREALYFFNIQPQIAQSYGIRYKGSPEPGKFLEEGDKIRFGNTTLDVYHVPGHSRGSICLHHRESKTLIAGDVLFQESIGRTDLPGGDYDTLIRGIKTKLLTLDPETRVYPGHGPSTTIGYEKENNPFLK